MKADKTFTTKQLHKDEEIEAKVVDFGGDMAVCASSLDGPVIITKQQAMEFFGLVDAN